MRIAISKTPLRLSLFGGGTDLPSFYKKKNGAVLSLAINKYLYVVAKRNQNYVDFKYRIFWSNTEFTNNLKNIKHPLAREILKYFKIDFPIEISTFSELPANSGLGSSSSFAVGMIKAVSSLINKKMTNKSIAKLAAHIEIDILKRNIGKQDHYAAAIGGINLIKFKKNEQVNIEKLKVKKKILEIIKNNFILFFLDKKRDASKILSNQINLNNEKIKNLIKLKNFAYYVKKIIMSKKNKKKIVMELGSIMHKSWMLKKSINSKTSYKVLDNFYEKLKKNQFYGGKLLGAGGGGYFLGIAKDKIIKKISRSIKNPKTVKVNLSNFGTKIIYNN